MDLTGTKEDCEMAWSCMKISVLFDACSRPLLTKLVLERAKDILEKYNYEFFLLYGRIPDKPYDEIVTTTLSLFDVKDIIIPIQLKWDAYKFRGVLFNKALDNCTGDYILFLENDFYWREDRLTETVKALENVDFMLMMRKPFKNFSIKTLNYWVHAPITGYAYNFGPSLRKDYFPVGRYREDLHSDKLEGYCSDLFNSGKKVAAVLPIDSFSHIGLVNSNHAIRLQHFHRENIHPSISEAIKWFSSFSASKEHTNLFIRHLYEETTRIDEGIETNETFSSNIL